jgi:hypothetical protein
MLLGQSDSTKKLLKTQEMFDKVSQDNKKKSDQIEKYQRDVKYMEDRIRNLEISKDQLIKITNSLFTHITCVNLFEPKMYLFTVLIRCFCYKTLCSDISEPQWNTVTVIADVRPQYCHSVPL